MYYFMIIMAACLFALQFLFQNGYQKTSGAGINSSVKFSLYTSVIGFAILLIINKFRMEFSVFSVLTAIVYSIVYMLLNHVGIKAFNYANLSVFSVFAMVGGMVLPYSYGILCGEKFELTGLMCCLVLICSVVMSINGGGHSKRAVWYYIAVFLLNGLIAVISKFHQSYENACVDSGSFMLYTKIIVSLMSIVLLLAGKEKSLSVSMKELGYSVAFSVATSVGNLLLLVALLYLPASVQYPVVTGGVIVFSTIITALKREKLTIMQIASSIIAFGATVLMIL